MAVNNIKENIKVSAVMKLETLPEEDSPAERAAATDGSVKLEADQVQLFLQKEHMLLQMVFSMEDNPAHTGAVQDSKASNRPQKTSHLMIKRLRALSSTCV